MSEARLRERLTRWFEEVYEAYNRNNLVALMFKDTAVKMFAAILSTPNLEDYLKDLYLILREHFEGG